MYGEFKAFIARGNVLDLAVAVIIGAAFGKIVTSLTEDLIMPVIGAIFGGLDFANYFVRLGADSRRVQGHRGKLRRAQGCGRGDARLRPVHHRGDQFPDPRLRRSSWWSRPPTRRMPPAEAAPPVRARSNCSPRSATSCAAAPDRGFPAAHRTRSLHIKPASPISGVPASAGYGDKLRCAIDAADPGAVPGGSTKTPGNGFPDGAELGSTCVEKHCFCPG